MRITLGTREYQYGLVFKKPKWAVECKIDFSEEELGIIRQHNLLDLRIYTQTMHNDRPDEAVDRTLKEVIKHGIMCTYSTPVDAQKFENYLKEELLPMLKNYIQASGQKSAGPETFEL
jgi:hypothetical protein